MGMPRLAALAAGTALSGCLFIAAPQAADYGYASPGGYDSFAATPAPGGLRWAGVYGGVQLGYGWGDTGTLDTNGFLGGVTLGANWQQDAFVFGAEADIAYSGIGDSRLVDRYDLDWIGTIRGRIGYAFDRFMVFGTGGVAWTSAEYALRAAGSDSAFHVGWTLGLGAEAAVTDRVSVRVDYLHLHFGDEYYSVGPGLMIEPSANLLRVGLNYRF